MPTLLELCGIAGEPDRGFDGMSLSAVLRGENPEPALTERDFVTDTQRVAHPLKWRMSCAMTGRWRLVNREELYDLGTDPGQKRDVAAEHPDLVARLQQAYEKWWARCREGIDASVPVPVGASADGSPGETVLRTHDLRSDLDHGAVWNQGDVRAGRFTVGWWEIDVQSAGRYVFDLRRWPAESGHAIDAGIDGDDVPWDRDGVAPDSMNWYTGGKSIPYTQATVIVDDAVRAEASIPAGAESTSLELELPAGVHHLRAILSNARGDYCSAYYVHVRRQPAS
jgi:hypothetical protein